MTREVIDLSVETSVRAVYDAQLGRLVGWTTPTPPTRFRDPGVRDAVAALVQRVRTTGMAVCRGGKPRARPLAQARS